MSIETIKRKFVDECNVILYNVDDLINNLSSNCSYSINCSFDLSREIVTDLYDKDNVNKRRFDYLKFPKLVK